MKTWRLMKILLLVVVMAIVTTGTAFASPLLQQEGQKVGLFGTVVVMESNVIKLDTGKELEITPDTGFTVPGVETAGPEDVSVGDRVSILALEGADGTLTALQVVVVPGEPVYIDHLIGVVIDVTNGIVTLIDDEGNSYYLELDEGAASVGDLITVVTSWDEDTGEHTPTGVESVEDLIEDLVDAIDTAVGDAVDRLRELVEDNAESHYSGLEAALLEAGEQAKEALENAYDNASSHHNHSIEVANSPAPYEEGAEVEYEGTVFEFVEGDYLRLDNESGPVFDISDADIYGTLYVGAEVEVEGAEIDGTLFALKIDAEEEEEYEGEFRGTVFYYVEGSYLQLNGEDDPIFNINEYTEIEGLLYPGAEVEVEATGYHGALIATEIEVEEGPESEYEGTVARLIFEEQDGQQVLVGLLFEGVDHPFVINDATDYEGVPIVGAKVELEVIAYDGTFYALEIEVEEEYVGEETCNGEINGEIVYQNLVVGPGDTCTITDGAEVYGNIDVEGGTLLVTEHGSVDGNIDGDGGASITVEDYSFVGGHIRHEGGSGVLTIVHSHVDGDVETRNVDTVNITSSFIDGDIKSKDDGTVTVTDNIVNGSLEISYAGSCTETGNTVHGNNLGCVSGAAVLDAGEEEQERFEGTITAIEGDIWTVTVDQETKTVDVSGAYIDGTPEVGLSAKVEGSVDNSGVTVASRVKIQDEDASLDLDGLEVPTHDTSPPEISVSGVADGEEYTDPVTPVLAAVDDADPNPTVIATLNGEPFTSGTTVGDVGRYELIAIASDASGNESEVEIDFRISESHAQE